MHKNTKMCRNISNFTKRHKILFLFVFRLLFVVFLDFFCYSVWPMSSKKQHKQTFNVINSQEIRKRRSTTIRKTTKNNIQKKFSTKNSKKNMANGTKNIYKTQRNNNKYTLNVRKFGRTDLIHIHTAWF